jgi:tRNA dimethylallyltransferase
MPITAVLAGPTASGKTALALRWALQTKRARNLEIISADSRQIYRDFVVGTGVPPEDQREGVPHHLLGFLDPRESYSPRRFRADAEALVAARPDANFLVVGGTGLYLKEWMYPGSEERGETPRAVREAAQAALAEAGLEAVHADLTAKDPEGMRRVDPSDAYRITKRLENWLHTGRSYAAPKAEEPLNPLFEGVPFLWLEPDRKELHRRIEARAEAMFRAGWADEVRALLAEPHGYDPMRTPAFNAIGYRELAAALTEMKAGKPPESVQGTVVARTRQYAKKQVTFVRHQVPHAAAWEPAALERALDSADWDVGSLPNPHPPA